MLLAIGVAATIPSAAGGNCGTIERRQQQQQQQCQAAPPAGPAGQLGGEGKPSGDVEGGGSDEELMSERSRLLT